MGRPPVLPKKKKDGFYIEIRNKGAKSGTIIIRDNEQAMMQAAKQYETTKDVIILGKHENGEPITSCVVTGDVAAQSTRRVLPPKSGNQRIVWDALGELLRKTGDTRPDGAPESLPKGRPALATDAAIASVAERLACDPKRKKERAQQALEGLHAKGLIRIEAGFVWVT